MSKYYVILFLMTFSAAACNQTDNTNKRVNTDVRKQDTSAKLLIIPGKSIGKINLGEGFTQVEKEFGRPDQSDAAMGSALFTWYAKHDTAGYRLSIFGNHNYGGKDEAIVRIKKIRVTSPSFKTADAISVGATKAAISKNYNLKTIANILKMGRNIVVYADVPKGIAFEINAATTQCVAILIFKPNDVPSTYIDMH